MEAARIDLAPKAGESAICFCVSSEISGGIGLAGRDFQSKFLTAK
jgi:hypothetical protein